MARPTPAKRPSGFQEALFRPDITWCAPTEFPRLRGSKIIGLDTETRDEDLELLGPGCRRPNSYIVGISIGREDGGRWYFPIRHEGGGNLDSNLVLRWARDELNNFEGEVVGGNILYDMDFLANEGIELKKAKAIHDICVAEPLIDEWAFSYSVDAISNKYLGYGKEEDLLKLVREAYGWKDQKTLKRNLWRLPAGYVGAYAEGDADRPMLVLPHQMKIMKEEGLEDVYSVERRLLPILLGMRRRGVRIDPAYAETLYTNLKEKLAEQVAIMRRHSSSKAELNMPDSFADALTERGLSFPRTPKTDKPQIRKPWLEAHQNDPLVAAILNGRQLDTIIGTFIEGHVFTHSINGRIHAEFNQLKNEDGRGTIARFSSSNPNLQNVPSRHKILAPMVRRVFIPEDTEVWQRDDYSQIEYRLLVNFAVGRGAEEARNNYRNNPGMDYHKFVAEMLNVDPEDKIKRGRVKNTNFAKGYGAQAPKLAETFGCSLEEAQVFIREYEEKLPFSVETFEAAERWAKRRGYIVTLLNRRQRFPLWEPLGQKGKNRLPAYLHERALKEYGSRIQRAATYTALNRKMQASSADMMKKSMVDAYEAGLFASDALGWPLLTVHDELDSSVPTTPKGDAAGKALTKIMEDVFPLKIPVLVDSKRGPDWGYCK